MAGFIFAMIVEGVVRYMHYGLGISQAHGHSHVHGDGASSSRSDAPKIQDVNVDIVRTLVPPCESSDVSTF